MMGTKKVGFIHTTPATIGMAESFMKACLPGVEWIHRYDGLVKMANFASPIGVTPKINLLRYAVFAEELERAGCGVIVSCCSLMPRATAYASAVVDVPFIQLDAVILDETAANYRRIGIINTTPYSVPYIREGLLTRAEKQGRSLELLFSDPETERALGLFNAGDFDAHDEVVLRQMRRLEGAGVDCLLMGQIPFAMLEEKIGAQSWSVPVLCAGRKAFAHVAALLRRQEKIES
ncbi:MAG: aspartate/glutamate racemase family protein [Deltaproteobacteria bacterium]|nr:aspartate/glutamate racemase family protein [Deltaproteobacteria bacterium]